MITTNLNQFTNSFLELERKMECGYIPSEVAFKVDKFARVILQNNQLQLIATFNNENPFLTTPTTLYLASDDVADTFEVTIEYIDQNRDKQTLNINLNGTTPVALGTNIYCVYRMFNNNGVDQMGDRVVVTSNVSGVPSDDNEVYCEMIQTSGIAANQSLSGVFSIPRNYTGFITRFSVNADKGSDVKGGFLARSEGKVFRFIKALETFEQQAIFNNIFEKSKEKTDFKPMAIAQTGGVSYFEYSVICIHNEYLNEFQ